MTETHLRIWDEGRRRQWTESPVEKLVLVMLILVFDEEISPNAARVKKFAMCKQMKNGGKRNLSVLDWLLRGEKAANWKLCASKFLLNYFSSLNWISKDTKWFTSKHPYQLRYYRTAVTVNFYVVIFCSYRTCVHYSLLEDFTGCVKSELFKSLATTFTLTFSCHFRLRSR